MTKGGSMACPIRVGGRLGDGPGVSMTIEVERETDGRWLAEVLELPGVMLYAPTRDEAIARVKILALRVLADRLEHGELIPELNDVFAVPA